MVQCGGSIQRLSMEIEYGGSLWGNEKSSENQEIRISAQLVEKSGREAISSEMAMDNGR